MFTGHQEVKAFGHEEKAIQQFDEVNERLYQSGWKAQFISGLMMPTLSADAIADWIVFAIPAA